MRKLLLGLVSLLAFTACNHNDFEPMSTQEMKDAKYSAKFEKTFGAPASTHTWGFATTNTTRTVVKSDMTDYPSDKAPAAITDAEREYVTNWFKNNPGLSEVGRDWSEFFIQWVSGDFYNKKGLWHRYDQNRVNNGYDSNYWDEEFTDNAVMDYLIVSDNNGYTEHVLDFNSNSGGPNSIVYMKNSSALYFGYHSSWDSNDYQYFKLAEIDVPNVGKGWYVGLSVYGKKYDNGDKELGIQRLDYAEDWILKIVPGTTNKTVKERGRVICEDLGVAENTDFDFNDVVFDAVVYTDGTYDITLLAAGGTIPLTVGGHEVHNEFDVDVNVMVNTNAPNGASRNPVSFSVTDNTVNGIIDIPIMVRSGNEVWTISAPIGKAPQKLCVSETFKWCQEFQSIKLVYPYFVEYVSNPTIEWEDYYDVNLVMP